MEQKPVAYINVEKRTLEWAKPTRWETPTIAALEPVPLYTHPAPNLEQLVGANEFHPDWDTVAPMVEEQQRMAARIEELENALSQLLAILGPTPPECCGCAYEWQAAIDLIKGNLDE